ncbi:MAG: hypothetical protein LBP79_02350 [Clostridiales bacterium]|jgi:hypothetical protein|nr:hypothetical protein [Clostridiales bacterium]
MRKIFKSERKKTYDDAIHTEGRIWITVCEILFVSAPVLIALYLQAAPIWSALLSAFGVVAVIYWTTAAGEFILYAPLLGPGATYLAFVTGNISNIKLPCALNAQEVAGVKRGSKESEIVSTISVAVSSIVTTLIVSVGVAFLAAFSEPLERFFNNEYVAPVFKCILPSLFGALGYSYVRKYPKLGIAPFLFVVVMFTAVPSVAHNDSVSTMIILTGAVSLAAALIMNRKKLVV